MKIKGGHNYVYLVVVGCCGFAGKSVIQFLTDIEVASNARGSVIVQLQETA